MTNFESLQAFKKYLDEDVRKHVKEKYSKNVTMNYLDTFLDDMLESLEVLIEQSADDFENINDLDEDIFDE